MSFRLRWCMVCNPETYKVCNMRILRKWGGSCQIIFHTSGPAAKEVDPNYVFPSDVTDMAGLLMGRCVHDGKSGYITKGLKNSIDSMVDPDVGFGEGKYRKLFPFDLDCRPEGTSYTRDFPSLK